FTKGQKRLVYHDLDFVFCYSRAIPEPEAKRQIHGSVTVTVRDPLHEQASRRRHLIQILADAVQFSAGDLAQLAVDGDPETGFYRLRTCRTPDMNVISLSRQPFRHQPGVVAHAALLWWVFASNDVPVGHCCH